MSLIRPLKNLTAKSVFDSEWLMFTTVWFETYILLHVGLGEVLQRFLKTNDPIDRGKSMTQFEYQLRNCLRKLIISFCLANWSLSPSNFLHLDLPFSLALSGTAPNCAASLGWWAIVAQTKWCIDIRAEKEPTENVRDCGGSALALCVTLG